MATHYSARAYRNPGRRSYVIAFRHPLKTERGKPGRKVCKGLGTENADEAARFESQMNELLSRVEFHSVAARAIAAEHFDPCIIDIFFEDLDPSPSGHRLLRDDTMPLPSRADGYERTLVAGITGVGKTTLLRRLIGSHPERDRFPSTSVNRTTTCDIEVITGSDEYQAVVTFLSRHQAHQEINESLSTAVLKAIEGGTDEAVVAEFLEQSDQRFRLKYVLGDWGMNTVIEEDAFTFDLTEQAAATVASQATEFLRATLDKIRQIATSAKKEIEDILDPLDLLKGDARDYALDEMQQAAEQSDDFLELANELLDEVAERFSAVTHGEFKKSSLGWPTAWTVSTPSHEREAFFAMLRQFAGTSKEQWGHLLTPLVTGIRVRGNFRPDWAPEEEDYNHVFIDTEGLLHAKTATEVPSELTSRFKDVDTILFVESAKNSLHSPIASRVFEAVASTGYTSKFSLLFTHMDSVTGDNLSSPSSKRAHVFGGAKNVLENEVARHLSREAARQLALQLETNTFYLAYLDSNRYPTSEKSKVDAFEAHLGQELWRLCDHLDARSHAQQLERTVPIYSFESLGLAVREASVAFQEIWDARLGYKRSEGVFTAPWQSIKAMTRRYAEGWFDGYWLRPIDTLISTTRNVLTRFLETPLEWQGKKVREKDKALIVDRLKQLVNDSLTELSRARLWKGPQPEWQRAYGLWGKDSTFVRRQEVQRILHHNVPVPESVSDRWAQQWVEDLKKLVVQAVDAVKGEQNLAGLPKGDGTG